MDIIAVNPGEPVSECAVASAPPFRISRSVDYLTDTKCATLKTGTGCRNERLRTQRDRGALSGSCIDAVARLGTPASQAWGLFVTADFEAVRAHRRLWIWLYRVHLFGHVASVMAFVALATLASGTPSRIIIWPAVAVLGTGLMMGAVAAAFYYHFGAWGSADMDGKPADVIRAFIDSLRITTEYVTCLVRFSRVFIGSIRVSQRHFGAFRGFAWVIRWESPCGSSWKTPQRFPRRGGRVRCVHGAVSFHRARPCATR